MAARAKRGNVRLRRVWGGNSPFPYRAFIGRTNSSKEHQTTKIRRGLLVQIFARRGGPFGRPFSNHAQIGTFTVVRRVT